MSHADLIARLGKLEGPDREIDAEIAVLTRWRPLGIHHWVDDHPAGMSASTHLPGWVVLNEPPVPDTRWEAPAYTASLDAAIGLVERVLPGCDICWQDIHADFRQKGEARHIAEVMHDLQWVMDEGFPEPTYLTKGSGQSNSRPIALLIATLKALEQQNG